MLKAILLFVWLPFAAPLVAQTSNVSVVIDTTEAEAVLQAVQDPHLKNEQALQIARLPGSQGLIRKALSYDRPASEALFAQALMAAAHHETASEDQGQFQFDSVRNHAGETARTLAALQAPTLQLLTQIKARVAQFTPTTLSGTVTGHLVLGGASYGFALGGEPAMYLDLEHVRSATLASTIFEHELFHSVQMLARLRHPAPPQQSACLAKIPKAQGIEDLLAALSAEGTASLVGDLLALPEQKLDEPTRKERADFAEIVDGKKRYITDLELSVHGLGTDAAVSWQEVYAAGFNGNQPFYGIGYVMAKAIAKERGDAAIAALIDQSGAAFVTEYVGLTGYGKTKEMPALDRETVSWAHQIASCMPTHAKQ